MTNWKKTNGKPVEETVNMSMHRYNDLKRGESIRKQIDKLSPDRQKIVLSILETLLGMQGEDDEIRV